MLGCQIQTCSLLVPGPRSQVYGKLGGSSASMQAAVELQRAVQQVNDLLRQKEAQHLALIQDKALLTQELLNLTAQ